VSQRAIPATIQEMGAFHTPDYLSLLKSVKPENRDTFEKRLGICNLGFDSPIFDGLFEFCTIYAGNSMEGAARLAREKCEIAVNWAGGLHHAKKAESSGFCYVNGMA
jgi:histone deacetylase 1/2